MTTRLVIAEKPSVARDIAGALESKRGVRFTKTPWGFESPDWIIASARGHLLAEAQPERYDPALKAWSLDTLPILPETTQFVPRDKDSATLLKTLVGLINANNVDEVVNACDAGREGELIFKLIYDYAQSKKPVARAWFSSMTADTLIAALENLRPDSEMKSLEAAAKARASADWVVGINATRAATVKLDVRQLISLGRVQTPTLALVVQRDIIIENFVPVPYYVIKATAEFTGEGPVSLQGWHQTRKPSPEPTSPSSPQDTTVADDSWSLSKFKDKATAEEVRNRILGKEVILKSDDKNRERSRPPKLFDLTNLQKAANSLFGYSAAKTLEIAQKCYEEYKILTYPRTDSSYLPTDMVGAVEELLTSLARQSLGSLSHAAATLLSAPDRADRIARITDDAKITDHHAIIPTGTPPPKDLDDATRSVYGLVMRRFLAALSDDAYYDKRVILIEAPASNDIFKTTGKTVVQAGWTEIYPGPRAKKDEDAATNAEDADADVELPAVNIGAKGKAKNVEVNDRLTKPPLAYTDASLLTAMATAGKLLEDVELALAMKESGLGTPATRASIIERLLKIDYLERKGKYIKSTRKAKNVIELLDGQVLTSPEVTGAWEKALGQIEAADPQTAATAAATFTAGIKDLATGIVSWFKSIDATDFNIDDILGPCPVPTCAGQIVERKSSWSCNSWKSADEPGCGYVIWKKQNDKRITRAKAATILKESDGTVAKKVERQIIAPCPTNGCEGSITEGEKVFSCNSWKSPKETGCGFVLWKTRKDGTVLTTEQAIHLINEGANDKRPELEVLAPCPKPRCKGGIVEREKSFSCNSWSPKKKGCGTTLWKFSKSGAVLISRENLLEELEKLKG